MAKLKETFKKKLMKYLWRIQQTQMVISIVFWSLTLTGVFYEYVRERFNNFYLGQENVFAGMMVMFTIIILFILMFGFVYDKLKFWKEQQLVIVERNPYTSWKLNPVQTMWVELWVAAIKDMQPMTPVLKEKVEFYEKWIARLEEIDPWTKQMRSDLRKFVIDNDDTVLRTFGKSSDE